MSIYAVQEDVDAELDEHRPNRLTVSGQFVLNEICMQFILEIYIYDFRIVYVRFIEL